MATTIVHVPIISLGILEVNFQVIALCTELIYDILCLFSINMFSLSKLGSPVGLNKLNYLRLSDRNFLEPASLVIAIPDGTYLSIC